MSGEPKRVDVKVVYKPGKTPNVELVSKITTKEGLLKFKNDKHDGFWVHFNLDDDTLADYRFVQSGMSPMYSVLGDQCPTQGLWDGFKPHDVFERTLIVRNKNVLLQGKSEERFSFALRVTKDPAGNGPVVELDPGGVNQNGPTKPLSKAALLITGGVVGAVLALGAEALLS